MNHLLVKHVLTFLLLCIFPLKVYGEDVAINWSIKKYESESVQVGDTVTFTFSSNHTTNVFIHPSGDCDETGRIDFGGSASPATYTFAEDDIGEVVFACDVGSHCELGQIVTFNVIAEGEGTPTSAPTSATIAGEGVDTPTSAPTAATSAEEGEDTPISAPTSATSAGATMRKTLGFSWMISMVLLHLW